MKIFERSDLESLLVPATRPCVSVLMPTVRHYPQSDQNPIRFRNLVKRVESLLGALADNVEVHATLDRLHELAKSDIWRSPRAGLAVFASPGFFAYHRVPVEIQELVTVADTFHVKPLLGLLAANRRFLVLSLSLKKAELFEGHGFSLWPVEPPGFPATIDQALGPELGQPYLNLHANRPEAGGAIFHGHGTTDEFKKEDAVRYYRVLDEALCATFRGPNAPPLVLAGAATYLPIYREVSRYPRLTELAAEGNFEHASAEELHAKALPAAKAHLDRYEDKLLSGFDKVVSRGQATTDLAAVSRAMAQGRIRALFLAEGARVWGTLSGETGEISIHPTRRETGDEDILDDLAEGTLARGGETLILPRERMPGGADAAALFRW